MLKWKGQQSGSKNHLLPKRVFRGDRKTVNTVHWWNHRFPGLIWKLHVWLVPPVSGTGGKWRFIGFYRDPLLQIIIILMVTRGDNPNEIPRRWLRWKFFHSEVHSHYLHCQLLALSHEYRTKLGMNKVVLRGSWGCHCCKNDRGPP